ncbi:MAG TPA: AtpZ/AtpI family protein, partial [Candidatus Limnocylindrales bacterium]
SRRGSCVPRAPVVDGKNTAPVADEGWLPRPVSMPAVATRRAPLLYSRRLVRSYIVEPGRVGAYLALFSEIGLVLLVTTLAGVLVGYWADTQVGTLPVFVLIGLAAGMGAGAVAVRRLITRFLASFDD